MYLSTLHISTYYQELMKFMMYLTVHTTIWLHAGTYLIMLIYT